MQHARGPVRTIDVIGTLVYWPRRRLDNNDGFCAIFGWPGTAFESTLYGVPPSDILMKMPALRGITRFRMGPYEEGLKWNIPRLTNASSRFLAPL